MEYPNEEPSCCKWQRSRHLNDYKNGLDDSLLVRELNDLTVDERERVFDEIHGVAPAIQEGTPGDVDDACENLLKELQKITRMKRKAYERAVFLRPSLEHDTKFMLLFLRAERHDAALAAKRICSFFTHKLELFGDSKLVKDITLDDLDEGDMEALRTGALTVLPDKDQAGRTVIFLDAGLLQFRKWQNLTRYFWYMLMSVCTDEESQIKGIVDVEYYFGVIRSASASMEVFRYHYPIIAHSIPVRAVGIHYCFDAGPIVSPIFSLMQTVMGTENRIRLRFHNGSNLEAQYKLLTFGIKVPSFQWNPNQKEHKDMIEKYISERQKTEEQNAGEEAMSVPEELDALYPRPEDVLLGRGRPYHSFPGNHRLGELLDEYQARYISCSSRLDKTFVAMEVVQRIHDEGGRFLERVNLKGWKVTKREKAEQKVAQAIRNRVFCEKLPTTMDKSPPMERANKKLRRTMDANDENGGGVFHWFNN